jgi:DNA repair exonuclease SbcCD ATPase subunit
VKLFFSSFIVVFLTVASSSVFAIKKCEDADGNWHYGDVAVEECENSKITTLNDRGFVKEELAAPKTAEEIQAEEEAAALEDRELAEERRAEEEKRRILSIYETEDDIIRQRDNQIRSVQSNIDVHEAYLKSMDTRVERYTKKLNETKNKAQRSQLEEKIVDAEQRISDYEGLLEDLREQKEEIINRFEVERKTYLELKNSD